MELRRLNNPSLWPLSRDQSDPPLGYPFHGDRSLGADDVIPQAVVTLHRGRYIRFLQDHEVLVPSLYGNNYLWDFKAVSVPNIVLPQVESQGAGQMVLRRRWCQVKAVSAMLYQLGESNGHAFPPTVDLYDSTRVPQ